MFDGDDDSDTNDDDSDTDDDDTDTDDEDTDTDDDRDTDDVAVRCQPQIYLSTPKLECRERELMSQCFQGFHDIWLYP